MFFNAVAVTLTDLVPDRPSVDDTTTSNEYKLPTVRVSLGIVKTLRVVVASLNRPQDSPKFSTDAMVQYHCVGVCEYVCVSACVRVVEWLVVLGVISEI